MIVPTPERPDREQFKLSRRIHRPLTVVYLQHMYGQGNLVDRRVISTLPSAMRP